MSSWGMQSSGEAPCIGRYCRLTGSHPYGTHAAAYGTD